MTKLFATSALIAATIIAVPAAANTVLLDYQGQDVKVENGSQSYDFFNLGPRQDVPQLMVLKDEPQMRAGPFTPDGRSDFRIITQEDGEGPGFGEIQFLYQNNFPQIEVLTVQGLNSPMDDYMVNYPTIKLPSVSQRINFASVEGEIATFGDDGANGNIVDNSFDFNDSLVSLYGGRGDDLLVKGGDSAILGFRIDVLLENMYGYGPNMLTIAMPEYCDGAEAMYFEDCEIETPPQQVLASFFGFVEVTRGSVTPGLLGVNNLVGAAAVVPTVPLPAPIMMLGAGLAGLGLMRRRKHS